MRKIMLILACLMFVLLNAQIIAPCGTQVPYYNEDFETYLDLCWVESEGPVSGPDTSDLTSAWIGGVFLHAQSGSNCAKINLHSTSRDEWLISPVFDLTSGGYEINLNVGVTDWGWAGSSDMGSDDSVRVMQSLDGGITWTTIFTWTEANQPSNVGDNISINIGTVTSANARFAIYATTGPFYDSEDYDFFVDDFKVRTIPLCPEPGGFMGGLMVSSVLANSVKVDWSAGDSETLWEIEYGLNGFITGSGSTVTVNDTTYTLTGLTANSDYQIYVRSICGASDSSEWVGPVSFSTLCSEVPNYIEGFGTYLNPCWSESRGPVSGPDYSGVISGWTSDNFLNESGGSACTKVSLGNIYSNEWLISPIFDLTSGGYEINLDVGMTVWGTSNPMNMGVDDSVRVMQSLDGGTTWATIHTWTVANQPSHLGDNISIDISTVTSATARFAFYAKDGPISDPGWYDFFVDNFAVRGIQCSDTMYNNYTGCQGDGYSVVVNSNVYNESNPSGIDTLTNMFGCDSIVYTNLVYDVQSSEIILEVTCLDTLNINNQIYTSTGVYTQTLTNASGCDSVLTLDLTFNTPSAGNYTETTCLDTLEINNEIYTSTGVYTQTLTNVSGCDSILTLDLTFNTPSVGNYTETTCLDTLEINNEIYTSTGVYTQTLTSVAGCDSVLTLDLIFNTSSTGNYTETTCLDTLEINGQVYTLTGVYTQTLTNASGCDSVLTLDLTFSTLSTGNYTETTCLDTLEINNEIYTSTGVYTQTLTSVSGCDSVLTLDLTFNTSSAGSYVETTCLDTLEINNEIYTSTGEYTQILTSASGCDSVLTLDLTFNASSNAGSFSMNVCVDTLEINGIVYTSSGVYTQTLISSLGCDSLLTLDLVFEQSDSVFLDTLLCGQSIFEYEGFIMHSTGHYEFEQTQPGGCPTVFVIDVEFIDDVAVEIIQSGNTLICNQTTGTFQWYDCVTNLPVSGEVGNTFIPEVNGEYYVEVTQNGCIYNSDCFITFGISLEEVDNPQFTLYPNPNNGHFYINLHSGGEYKTLRITTILGEVVYVASINPEELNLNFNLRIEPGIYFVQLEHVNSKKWTNQKILVSKNFE